jgi:hypothetical protein
MTPRALRAYKRLWMREQRAGRRFMEPRGRILGVGIGREFYRIFSKTVAEVKA